MTKVTQINPNLNPSQPYHFIFASNLIQLTFTGFYSLLHVLNQ